MSGGVDSSVAAALLVHDGYEVTGMMLRLWSETGPEWDQPVLFSGCDGSEPDGLLAKLGIPFYAIDAPKAFREEWYNILSMVMIRE
jgi:tRNA-uridine 2-sulfurtransferase